MFLWQSGHFLLKHIPPFHIIAKHVNCQFTTKGKTVTELFAISLNETQKTANEPDCRVIQYIEEWKSRLIDLSRRNSLLYFKNTKLGNLSIIHPTPEAIFNRLVQKKHSMEFWLPPEEFTVLQTKTQNHLLAEGT